MSSPRPRALRPDWLHDTLRLELAKNVWYEFRTLSLYDVWALWPHLLPFKQSLEQGRPIEWAGHLQEILNVLNPTLAKTPEHMVLIRPAHVDFLIDFYTRQDWSRIGELGNRLSGGGGSDEREKTSGTETDRRFIRICTMAAQSVSMTPLEFMQDRFEFCADVIVNLRAAMEEEATRGKIPNDKFFGLMSAVVPNVRVDAETKPAWMREIEEYAKNAENN